MTVREAVRERLMKEMYEREMTVKAMAQMCGIPYSTFSSYVCGNVDMSLKNAVKVADALEITVDDLIKSP